ncbi:MAG TPA: cupin domain-containing protein [Thermoanaerobaculia bacterium]|nr:cupin domain-containing protein [Thermoanaerobaculia bacterium]
MATVTVRDSGQVLSDPAEISGFLARCGIWYRKFEDVGRLPGEAASHEEILAALHEPIEELKAKGGYVTADVIDVTATTPGLDAMLGRFNKEHWHDEDEVRFIVAGRGLFHIHPPEAPVFSIEVERGDMILVPRGTHHWFDLCGDRRIRAIRLFQSTAGWTPNYTASRIDEGFQPVCLGYHDIPRRGL